MFFIAADRDFNCPCLVLAVVVRVHDVDSTKWSGTVKGEVGHFISYNDLGHIVLYDRACHFWHKMFSSVILHAVKR